jgi:general secretion pathway protein D
VERNDGSEIGVQGSYTGGNWGTALQQVSGYMTNYTFQSAVISVLNSVLSNGVPVSGTSSTTTAAPALIPTSITPTYAKNLNLGNSFNLPAAVSGASGNGGLYQVIGNDFTATVQAIAAAGKSQVLSRPSILARDGQLAKIVVGQEVYLPSGVTYTTSGTATIPIINGAYTEVGIILNVTPYIGANGLVEMIVQPQTSSVDSSTPGQLIAAGSSLLGTASTPVYAPNINLRSADTVVVTPSGQTVVIGGLISASKGTADSKIPFLGDIPILGALFKSTAKTDSKTELLMFLTPHIVDAPSQLAALSNPEMHQAPLITNSISEQELDRFLERVPVKKIEPVKKHK